MFRKLLILGTVVAVSALAAMVAIRLQSVLAEEVGRSRDGRAAPVEAVRVTRAPIRDERTFTGNLIARARFDVAPKVGGRLTALHVDIGDTVTPGMTIASLDDDEFRQAVAEAEAALKVAEARVALAESQLDLARRSNERVTDLQKRRIASGSAVDVAAADLAARRADVQVAEADVARAAATLEAARIRLGYADVTASWPLAEVADDRTPRVVSRRYVDAGASVAANAALVEVVDLSVLRAVFFVTERDYADLEIGRTAQLRTDAWPERTFVGRVARIAPVFEENSRQTRVEVEVDNADGALKPGMFVRARVVLDAYDDAVVVPLAALVRRDGEDGLFVVSDDETTGESTVRFVAFDVGIRTDDRIQLLGEDADRIVGRQVVVLGQQLVDDGSEVKVFSVDLEDAPAPPATPRTIVDDDE